MQLAQNRGRVVAAAPQPIQEILTPQQIRRIGAVEAAFVVCGAVSDDEVFVSDVLDVAAFILGDDDVAEPEDDEPYEPLDSPGREVYSRNDGSRIE